MDVEVRHTLAHPVVHGHERSVCVEPGFDGPGQPLCGAEEGFDLGLGEVGQGLAVLAGHEEAMPGEDGSGVEEGDGVGLVEDDLGRLLAGHDAAEEAVHLVP